MDGEVEELLFDTAFLDGIAAHLTPSGAAFMRRALRRLRASPPSLCGNHLIPVETIPATLEDCQAHLPRVLERLRWLRQSAFLQGSLEHFARRQASEPQTGCAFRRKWPPIPAESGHRFRWKPTAQS